MRLFLAVELGKDVKDELLRIRKEIEKTKLISAKYVEPENLHLTLKFFGELTRRQVDDIVEKLKEAKFEKFEAKLKNLGYFSEEFIRVLWAGLECDKIKSLSQKIENLLGKNEREFNCHITLARIKRISDKKKFKEFIKSFKVKRMVFLIDKIALKESILTEKGPIYSDVFVKYLD